jgi:PPIC-type PPIASE domain
MERERIVMFGGVIAVVGLAAALILQPPAKARGTADDAAGAGADAAPDGGLAFALDLTGGDAGDSLDLGSSLPSAGTDTRDRTADGGIGSRMADGTLVPPLPEKAPRTVHFGVVLVSYSGAQGAPATARGKEAAIELVQKLAAEAKTDFHLAVSHGDAGSSDDVGRVPRGVLELAPEYALFTLPAGGVSDPVETPRGFWIVKRLD